jgi:hypothetical protein
MARLMPHARERKKAVKAPLKICEKRAVSVFARV